MSPFEPKILSVEECKALFRNEEFRDKFLREYEKWKIWAYVPHLDLMVRRIDLPTWRYITAIVLGYKHGRHKTVVYRVARADMGFDFCASSSGELRDAMIAAKKCKNRSRG